MGKFVCKKSFIFVFEFGEVGLGKMFMMFWIVYGFVEKEGCGFFIDDMRWVYGEYFDIFEVLFV